MEHFEGFPPAAFKFLKQLKRNNNREWFLANKPTYEASLLAPMRLFVEEVDVLLADLAPEISGSPKRSIFRIYRDVRFSKDKSPYKTNMGCWFTHVRAGHGVGSETHGAGAGFYFHFEPGECMVAGGVWMPPRPALNKIREAVDEDFAGITKILGDKKFVKRFGELHREKPLTRVPKPFDKDHPAADLLKLVSFTVAAPISDADVGSAKLPKRLESDLKTMLPLVRWLNGALGFTPMTRR